MSLKRETFLFIHITNTAAMNQIFKSLRSIILLIMLHAPYAFHFLCSRYHKGEHPACYSDNGKKLQISAVQPTLYMYPWSSTLL